MKRGLVNLVLGIAVAAAGQAHARKVCEGIFPKNNLWIGPNVRSSGISQADFNAVLDKLTAIYGPVAQAHGFKLVFNRLWDDGTVNSDTDVEGTNWVVNSYGGLARYAGMTMDGYAAVACHELGHHLGGAPLFSDQDWASVEGEADYFATLKCLHQYFAGDDNQKATSGMNLDPLTVTKCSADFVGDNNSVSECERASAAGYVVAHILEQLDGSNPIAFNTPDKSQVSQTFEDHPQAQCRLDTYFAGALCTASPDIALDNSNYKTGACVTEADGPRPRCWFKPN
jgi:hypothetical protein